MSTLVAIVFNDESTAFEMRAALAKMQKQYLLEMEDPVVVTREPNGKIESHQAVSLTTFGAVTGAFWGMLIGLPFLNLFWEQCSAPGLALSRESFTISVWTTK